MDCSFVDGAAIDYNKLYPGTCVLLDPVKSNGASTGDISLYMCVCVS